MQTEAMQALYAGDLEKATALLGPDEDLTPPEAAAFGRLERLRLLLAQDPTAASSWSEDGFSALHLAVFGRQEEAVRVLIDHGADLEALSRHEAIRVRPLQTAAFVRAPQLAEILLDAGADVNSSGEHGFTALHSAAQNGDVALTRLLLARGANASLTNDAGKTPADLATGGTVQLLG